MFPSVINKGWFWGVFCVEKCVDDWGWWTGMGSGKGRRRSCVGETRSIGGWVHAFWTLMNNNWSRNVSHNTHVTFTYNSQSATFISLCLSPMRGEKTMYLVMATPAGCGDTRLVTLWWLHYSHYSYTLTVHIFKWSLVMSCNSTIVFVGYILIHLFIHFVCYTVLWSQHISKQRVC